MERFGRFSLFLWIHVDRELALHLLCTLDWASEAVVADAMTHNHVSVSATQRMQ